MSTKSAESDTGFSISAALSRWPTPLLELFGQTLRGPKKQAVGNLASVSLDSLPSLLDRDQSVQFLREKPAFDSNSSTKYEPYQPHYVVVGGGLQGVSTAFFLGRKGFKVTVVEKNTDPFRPQSGVDSPISVPNSGSFGSLLTSTGLLAVSSSLSPLFSRPAIYSAFGNQYCPMRRGVAHPNFYSVPIPVKDGESGSRSVFGSSIIGKSKDQGPSKSFVIDLFKSDTSHFIRSSITFESSRSNFLSSISKLYGLGLYNQYLAMKLISDFQKRHPSMKSPALSSGSLMLFDDNESFNYARRDLINFNRAHDSQADFAEEKLLKSSPAAIHQIQLLDNQQLVKLNPALKHLEFKMANGFSFPDEILVDHVNLLNNMKNHAQQAFGVEFLYGTEVKNIIHTSSSAGAIATAIEIDQGQIPLDNIVLCCGAATKGLIASSKIAPPVPTFSTKTHFLNFTLPDGVNLLPPNGTYSSFILPSTHTTISVLGREVRVRCGDSINDADHMDSTSSIPAPYNSVPTDAVETPVIRQMVDDLCTYFPQLNRTIISQGGKTVPHMGLHSSTADGRPLVGRFANNVFINSAHGSRGWEHSLASAKQISDLACNQKPLFDESTFGPSRFSKS